MVTHRLKIDVSKIDKTHLFKGAKGTYLDVALHLREEGTDQYGNDGFLTQDIGKEAREAGQKGPIIGNFRLVKPRSPKAEQPAAPVSKILPTDDDVPF